ncbi:MAG: hypothetical protein GXP10_10870 [Gammaproteobacteria bacterium]|nr:hypothetical protein [Gammaproteobacteria bacterium]
MRALRTVLIPAALWLLSWSLSGAAFGDEYNGNHHCYNNDAPDASLARALKKQGPLLAVGASVSSGLFADEFPEIVAKQLCLEEGEDYFYRFSYFNRIYQLTFDYIQTIFTQQRPRVVLALDHLYHRFKKAPFTAETKKELEEWIARLVLDCNHPAIDCSEGGPYHFVVEEHYHPLVILGDLYYENIIDCTKPHNITQSKISNGIQTKGRNYQCQEDNSKINRFLKAQEKIYPNLSVISVKALYSALRTAPFLYHYDINNITTDFHRDDLLFDGFHPWTDPGAHVLANIVIERINRRIAAGETGFTTAIPYVTIDKRYIETNQP